MNYFDNAFENALLNAQDAGIAPVYFVTFFARDRDTNEEVEIGFWSGDYDITHNVRGRSGSLVSRIFTGGVGLQLGDIKYVLDMTDNSVTVTMNPFHEAINAAIRGYDIRMSTVEVHVTTWNGGALASAGQLVWVGIVDTAPFSYGAAGASGTVTVSLRSELMVALGRKNPAKSSDAHQKRRRSTDTFSQYSGVVESFTFSWYKP